MTISMDTAVGIDLGGTNAKMYIHDEKIIDTEGNVLSHSDETIILEILNNALSPLTNIKTAGIALPCTMVPHAGDRKILNTVLKFSALTKEKHNGILNQMAKKWGEKLNIENVLILNDGEAAAIDVYFNPNIPKKYKNIMVVTLGTSIGVGFIFGGQPYIGPYPSRASHIILDPEGDWCLNENHRGCWKTLAGIDFRKKLALNMGLKNPKDENLAMDTREIADLAEKGFKKAKLYFKYYAENVARGIATIISAVPVECVVIAGGVANAGDVLMEPLKERLQQGDLLDPDLAPLIEFINVPDFSVAHGAQIYAFNKLVK